MNIASIGLDGFPKNRIVLLKQFSNEGFVFYTNYNSEKGKAIANNNCVSLSFFWSSLERQIIIKGNANKTSENISDAYFMSRPVGSRLGALASNQSEIVKDRNELDTNLIRLTEQFKEEEVRRPKHWGGYMIRPVSLEFGKEDPIECMTEFDMFYKKILPGNLNVWLRNIIFKYSFLIE